jgi:TonB family protein
VTKVNPQYPPEAKSQNIEGEVMLRVVIDQDGDVYDVVLVSGSPRLAPAAIDAVKQWKYKPYLFSGRAVDAETTVPVNFTLSENPQAEGVVGTDPVGLPGSVQSGVIGSVSPSTPGDENHAPQRVRVSSGVMQALLVKKVPPQYPQDAKDQHIHGVVVLKINTDKEGNVYQAELVSGHPQLAPAAIEAVKQWKYKPYQLNGTPVEVESQVQINFTLVN